MQRQKPKQPVLTWHICPPPDIAKAVKKLAESETRATRNMVVVLLREALLSRGVK